MGSYKPAPAKPSRSSAFESERKRYSPPTRTRSLDGDVTTVTRDAPPSAAAAAAAPAAFALQENFGSP